LSYASDYAERVLHEELEKLKDGALSKQLQNSEERLSRAISDPKVGFGKPVWQGFIASAIFTFALFILALTLRFAAPDSSVGQLLQYLLAPDEYELKVIVKDVALLLPDLFLV